MRKWVSFPATLRNFHTIFGVGLVMGCCILASCQSSPTAPAPRPSPFESTNARSNESPFKAPAPPPLEESSAPAPLYALFGKSLIVPASRLFSSGVRPASAQLDDGRQVPLVLHRIALEPVPDGGKALTAAAIRWLGGASNWTELSPAKKGDVPATSIELCEVKLPVDSFGHWLWIGKEHVDLTWIPAESKPRKYDLGLPKEAKSDPFFLECLRLESLNPLLRWRGELIGYVQPSSSKPAPKPIPFADDHEPLVQNPDDANVLDRLAQQQAALWSYALARLTDADASACRQILENLVTAIQFESNAAGRLAPAWSAADESEQLLRSLLAERENPRRLGFVSREWLTRRPAATAWTSDDAGLLDADSKLPLPRIGVANFTPARVIAWARGEGESQAPELVTLDPYRTRVLAIPAIDRPPPLDGSIDRTGVDVHVGTWSAQLAVQRRPLNASPPGLQIAPALLDHTMLTWTRAQNISPLPTGDRSVLGALAGRLVREAGPSNTPIGSGWSLYFEVEKSVFEHQTLRIWFGPTGRALQTILVDLPETSRIPESGEATAVVRTPGGRDEILQGTQIFSSSTHWTVRLPIPNRAIERPGMLRMAVEHIRGDVRSCWPRAMFPWSTEPGRALINLTKW